MHSPENSVNGYRPNREYAPGTLIGVGVGPGDPELLTLAAVRALDAADVVAYHCKPGGESSARAVVAELLAPDTLEVRLEYPVTTGTTDHPGGYAGALADFYVAAASSLAEHLSAGRTVALIALGDTSLYSSFQHLQRMLSDFPQAVVPGISAPSAAAAAIAEPLAEETETLSFLTGTASETELTRDLMMADAAVIMKVGRNLPRVRAALARAGMLNRAWLAVRVGMDGQSTQRLVDLADDAKVPYFSVVVVPSLLAATEPLATEALATEPLATGTASKTAAVPASAPQPADHTADQPRGEVVVVGLGPGAEWWTTPEVHNELRSATDLVGYTTYVNRVPARPGQVRHLSDNKVEAERAAFALDLARRGKRVAVVSSGDPGVFAMATAVLETAEELGWLDVPVRVVPGMTAAQAVASRVGAPLGHDFGMISLSNRLKPWAQVRKRVEALLGADMAFAVYNPASKERRSQVVELKDIVASYRRPDTPVVVARAVGSDQEKVTVTTVADFDPSVVDMRTMLIIGASTTRAYQDADGNIRVYTARTYGDSHARSVGDLPEPYQP